MAVALAALFAIGPKATFAAPAPTVTMISATGGQMEFVIYSKFTLPPHTSITFYGGYGSTAGSLPYNDTAMRTLVNADSAAADTVYVRDTVHVYAPGEHWVHEVAVNDSTGTIYYSAEDSVMVSPVWVAPSFSLGGNFATLNGGVQYFTYNSGYAPGMLYVYSFESANIGDTIIHPIYLTDSAVLTGSGTGSYVFHSSDSGVYLIYSFMYVTPVAPAVLSGIKWVKTGITSVDTTVTHDSVFTDPIIWADSIVSHGGGQATAYIAVGMTSTDSATNLVAMIAHTNMTDIYMAFADGNFSEGLPIARPGVTHYRLEMSSLSTDTSYSIDIIGQTVSGSVVYGPWGSNNMFSFVYHEPNLTEVAAVNNTGSFCVYPNPASDLITIRSDASRGKGEYSILDALGRLVANFPCAGSETRFNCGEFPSGMYFVRNGEGKSCTFSVR